MMQQNFSLNQANQNIEVTYEMNTAIDAIKSRKYLKSRMLQNSKISNDCDMSTHASENSLKKLNSSQQMTKNGFTDYSYMIQKNNIKPLYQLNEKLNNHNEINSQSKRSNYHNHIRVKPFIDRSYDNRNDFDLKGLKNKINYTLKINQAIEAIQHQKESMTSTSCQNQSHIFSHKSSDNDKSFNHNTQIYYYESDSNKAQRDIDRINEDNMLIVSYDHIIHLPLEEQVRLLYNNNQQLGNKCKEQKQIIDELSNRSNKEKDLIDTNKQFKDFLIKENEEMGTLNKNYEYLLNIFIDFLNKLKLAKFKGEVNKDEVQLIDLNQLKKNPLLAQTFLENLKNSKLMKKTKNKKKNISKSQLSNQDDYNYDYYDQILVNCLPCSLGINNTSKGYSPLLCSPNRLKYLKRSRTPI